MLKVALVGIGFMGRMHASVYETLSNAQIVAIVDKDPKRLEPFGVKGFATVEEALTAVEIDAVDICLPTDLHREFTVKAANAGKHVLCEKPMALSVGEADEMIAAAERNGVRLMIAHCIRFWPEYAYVTRLQREGTLGRLLSINLTRYGEFPSWSSDNWLADAKRAGGGALDMHIHDTDYALGLLGEPEEMAAFGTEDARGMSQMFTTMRFADGSVAHLEGGWNLPPKTPFKMAFRAIFERGAAIMDGGPLTIYAEGAEPQTPEFEKMSTAGGGNISDLGGYYHEIKYFVDRVLSSEPFEVTDAQSSRRSLEVTLEEIHQAHGRQAACA
ncbi:Gfo/Idh/MocA family protein [Fimbriimonas ginsengisoli]|uniref:Oxidoreductase domain protein n=1 Tax=Fimbriimonas ginsengisoli Gsoil 348 TaxID=661478 RepID=A0A068NUL0_FIMGI|nr:Gfo/Idh/MocA family oxidoreductase [Fimbriimonas ginsengisoli]AIE85304.1 oxidoreductase domain protein [Fimbriimonas ginsengisoli Gsoil 348]